MSLETEADVEKLEKLIRQLHGLHSEISLLAKKSPNDAVNAFKLKLINKVLQAANEVLGCLAIGTSHSQISVCLNLMIFHQIVT